MKRTQSGESWLAERKASRFQERKPEEEGSRETREGRALLRDGKAGEESKAAAREDDLRIRRTVHDKKRRFVLLLFGIYFSEINRHLFKKL